MWKKSLILLTLVLLTGASGYVWEPSHVFAMTSEQVRTHLQESLQPTSTYRRHAIQNAVSSRLTRNALESAELVQQFYQQRLHEPAWSDDNGPLPVADELIRNLKALETEGLNPEHYRLLRIEATMQAIRQDHATTLTVNPRQVSELELLLSDAFLTVGHDLVFGRFPALQSSLDRKSSRSDVDVVALLSRALQDQTLAASLHSLIPSQAGYVELRKAVATYRHIASRGGWLPISDGRALKLGSHGERVSMLRNRLRVTGDLVLIGRPEVAEGSLQSPEAERVFDQEVDEAVRRFQRRHGLEVDGIVGRRTLRALNLPVESRLRQLTLNLERWRQNPMDFGDRYLFVNIPDYTLNVVEDGKSVMTMRVVVGKRKWQTPTFRSTMNYLVLNPYWVVPMRIGREEIVPRVKENPAYLEAQEMEMMAGWGKTARILDPYSIDWASVNEKSFPYRFRQRPGDRNALGQVKFKFPNPFSIYMHDTQARSLFAMPKRAYSHGCIRLERPIELAEFLLRETSWTPERVAQTLDQSKRAHVNLKRPIDVHIMYQTAWVDEAGIVQFRRDIYDYDKLHQKQLCKSSKYACS